MTGVCTECGAPFDGESCMENFHALLFLEAEAPPSRASHFQAVAAYQLQHPDSMSPTRETLCASARRLADLLDKRIDVQTAYRDVGREAEGARRVTRRSDDAAPHWKRGGWTLNIRAVTASGVEGYAERVLSWANAVRADLDADAACAGTSD